MSALIFWAAQSLPEIGFSLKPNYNSQVKFVQVSDTHGIAATSREDNRFNGV